MRSLVAAIVVGAVAIAIAVAVAVGTSATPPRRIAYVTGGTGSPMEVWMASAGGRNPRMLGPGRDPVLAPSGALVAASADGGHGPALIVYSSRGPAVRLFSSARVDAQPLAWSPDSRHLAVALTSRDPANQVGSGLAMIDLPGGSVRILDAGVVHGASFAKDGSNRLAYAIAPSPALSARVDVHVVDTDGDQRRALTHDGVSLNPVWGPSGIAFDRERRRTDALPAYTVWFEHPDGSGLRRLAGPAAPPLRSGLVPLAFAAGGHELLASYQGVDTDETWTIAIGSGTARQLLVSGQSVAPGGISSSGTAVLVDRGGFLEPPEAGTVESVPLGGGAARVLVSGGAEPSWNL
jgi:Tol biopolymer transport system component